MKDLEKIKSEDLACQVQDANPGNFAIEQEVAQLVGATVPQPTEPSADDARELGAQLLVFLRRALLPIRSALRTAVAAIYAHLDSRCTDYTPAAYDPFRLPAGPYDPMQPLTPRTLPNLLTALTAFAPRKISDLGDCPDGISFVHLAAGYNEVTELKDDNRGWTMSRALPTMSSVTKATIGCKTLHAAISGSLPNAEELNFPDLDHIDTGETGAPQTNIIYGDKVKKIYMPALKRFLVVNASYMGVFYNLTGECEIYMENCEYMAAAGGGSYPQGFSNIQGVTKIVFGTPHGTFDMGHMAYGDYTKSYNLIDIEIGEGADCNIGLANWNPTNVLADADKTATFLQNFKNHIALRLTANGSGKTLTLSQAVFDTIWNADGTPKSTDPDSVIYQINKIIKTDKHWSVNRA